MTVAETFPPVKWLWDEYKRARAWYSGQPSELRHAAPSGSFWASKERVKVHVPLAADIAAMSAGLIFAASPEITSDDEKTNARIEEIMTRGSIYGALLKGAEIASAYSGVFIKIIWDKGRGFPEAVIVPPDCGVCEWRGNEQRKITLWSVVREDDNGAVYRLEETFVPDGHIRTRLLKGDAANLGRPEPLDSIPETEGIQPEANSGAGNIMLAYYVPNMLPNHIRPWSQYGRSDYDALYGMFDELDEAYSAVQREVRLTKTRIIVPAEYLSRRDALFGTDEAINRKQWVFSDDTGAFTALDIDSDRNSNPITIINPALMAEDRLGVCDDLVRRILSMAGYAPQSAGLDISGTAESGTALNIRERKSIRTTETKKTFWWHALEWMVHALLSVDRAVFGTGVKPDSTISIELPAGTQPDMSQLAETVEQLSRAHAASIRTMVEMLHPEWPDDKVEVEVRAIQLENGMPVPNPTDPMRGDLSVGDPDEPV